MRQFQERPEAGRPEQKPPEQKRPEQKRPEQKPPEQKRAGSTSARPKPARPPSAQAPGELVGVRGSTRNGLGRPAVGQPSAKLRSDTLPDWRPEPGILEPPAAADAPPVRRPARAAKTNEAAEPGVLERLLNIRGWPLVVILAIQAALSLRLVWSATAFLDEGEYLTVGRLELAHFLHGAPMPDVATYLSGSPVVYPPLAALAGDIGGLAGARLLSLVFMLITTIALHGVARRLLASRTAAFFAAALFAWLGTAQFLGAFATYDAMALMLLAVATWCGVRAIEAEGALRYTLLCAGGLSLAVADAAKYASTLFNPVVLAVVVLAAWRMDGRKAALDAGGAMLLSLAVPLTVGYDVGGSSYGAGITSTTLTRTEGTDSVRSILDLSAHATGIIAVLAVFGAIVITVRRPGWLTVLLAWTLTGAEFLAPAEQARIHTLTSLFKHVGYGAWFACVIGGYLLAELPALLTRLSRLGMTRMPRGGGLPRWALLTGTAVAAVVVLAAGAYDVTVANGQYGDWANSRGMIAEMDKLVQPNGYYMVEDPSVVTYYLASKVQFSHVDSTYTSFNYVDPQTHKMLFSYAAFADSIKRGYFNDIVLAFGDTFGQDQAIVQDMDADHDYRLIDTIGYQTSFGTSHYEIFQRIPQHVAKPNGKRAKRRHRRRLRSARTAAADRPSALAQVRTHT